MADQRQRGRQVQLEPKVLPALDPEQKPPPGAGVSPEVAAKARGGALQ
jgi:hypothetical protein